MNKTILLEIGLLISVLLNTALLWLELKSNKKDNQKSDLSKQDVAMVKQIVNMMNFDGMDDTK